MQQTKKISSIGILDIILNLELSQKEANEYNININKYKSINDLQNLFQTKNNISNEYNFNIIDHISLSSDNNLINALLYINRAYNNKSFIEFIMPNEIQFNEDIKFIYKIIKYILGKNYFYIIENKITEIPSSIKFIIKIYREKTNEIIIKKEFQLFEKNNINTNNNLYNFFNEINYNFKLNDYFILDLDSFNNMISNSKNTNRKIYNNLISFLYKIIEQNDNIKILTILNKNIFDDNKITKKIKNYKEIIELTDIIFSFKDGLNRFLQTYNSIYKKSSNNSSFYEQNNKKNLCDSKDLILYNKDKYRKNHPRTTILFNEFDYISIYIQNGINMELDYIEVFFLNIFQKNINFSKLNNYYYYFIGGFLSRFIYDKPFKICSSAGQLLLNKILRTNLINYINVDDYNICVPNKKKLLRQYSYNRLEKLPTKEYNIRNDILSQEKHKTKKNIIFKYKDSENFFHRKNVSYLNKLGFIYRNDLLINEPNTGVTANLKKNHYFFKTPNTFNIKTNKNYSMINIFNRNEIKQQPSKKYKITRNFSMPFFDIDDKIKKKKNEITMKRINIRPKSNYCHRKNKTKYRLKINNNNKSQIFYKYKYYWK